VATALPGQLARRLGLADAVVLGLGAMLGAGVFAAFGPAARAAGTGLLAGLLVAAVVAYCNATASARLAALHPVSGGAYVYGRAHLGDLWGYAAGWAFMVGKTASCAAMALTVGSYLWPARPAVPAVVTVAALTAVGWCGVRSSLRVARVLVGVVLLVLAAAAVGALLAGSPDPARLTPVTGDRGPWAVLQAAGFLFFAFAGYARVATLGEEVRDPARTIPRAVPLALGLVLATYTVVAVVLLLVLGADGVAGSAAPLADATGSWPWLAAVVRVGAALAAVGSLAALLLGVSRTVLAMARDRHLPHLLAAVHPRHRVPHRAVLAVGVAAAAAAAVVDLRGAIGFSSFAVLVYYAVANASALTLGREHGTRLVPVVGLLGCVAVALSLPRSAVVGGAGVLAVGVLLWLGRRLTGRARTPAG
jgi:APA family basic amino acid/polyamine antiporter